MRFKLFLIISVLFCFSNAYSGSFETLKIGILTPHRVNSIQVIPAEGVYHLKVGATVKATIASGERITFISRGSLVEVRTEKAGTIGSFKNPILSVHEGPAYFRLYVLQPRKMESMYDDNLILTSSSRGLKLINQVALEKYVAGVVEAETGKGQTEEFYKVQAVISRTYALNNRRKHLFEGFNLNDQVDCQVYHGKCRWEPVILDAVDKTTGKVLVDGNMRMITAAFHSNSGGETVGSESVWSYGMPYLTPKVDEFSINGPHFDWEQTISSDDWLAYLSDKHKLDTSDELIASMARNYTQTNRHVYFLDPGFGVHLKEVRGDWKMKSTYFDIVPAGSDSLKIVGRGFGHGIGLSQEGAMRMADLGFSYTDILHFYYNDVHVIDLHALDFFQND